LTGTRKLIVASYLHSSLCNSVTTFSS